MIYRHQVQRTLRHDALAEFLQLQREKNALLAGTAAGLFEVTAAVPGAGDPA